MDKSLEESQITSSLRDDVNPEANLLKEAKYGVIRCGSYLLALTYCVVLFYVKI